MIRALAALRGESSVPEIILEGAMVNGLLELIRKRALEVPSRPDLVGLLNALMVTLTSSGGKK